MITLTANEAKTNFGHLLMKTQRQPVQISKYGKPVAMVVSMDDYAEAEELKLEVLRLRAERARLQIDKQEHADGNAFFAALIDGQHD